MEINQKHYSNFKKYAQTIHDTPLFDEIALYIADGSLRNDAMFLINGAGRNYVVTIGKNLINRSWKHSLVVFLHEVGHYLSCIYKFHTDDLHFDEGLAWVWAELLLEDLKWPIPKKQFNRIRHKCLKSYE